MYVKKIVEPIYDTRFYVVCNCSAESFSLWAKKTLGLDASDKSFASCAGKSFTNNQGDSVVWVSDASRLHILVHELFHSTMSLMDGYGVEDAPSYEPRAYFLSHVVSKLWEDPKFKKLICTKKGSKHE